MKIPTSNQATALRGVTGITGTWHYGHYGITGALRGHDTQSLILIMQWVSCRPRRSGSGRVRGASPRSLLALGFEPLPPGVTGRYGDMISNPLFDKAASVPAERLHRGRLHYRRPEPRRTPSRGAAAENRLSTP